MGKGGPQTFTFKTSGSTLTGTVEGGRGGPVDITNGKVDGDNVSFEVTREMNGNSMTAKYSGTVSGDTMKLTVDIGRGPREIELKKQLSRDVMQIQHAGGRKFTFLCCGIF